MSSFSSYRQNIIARSILGRKLLFKIVTVEPFLLVFWRECFHKTCNICGNNTSIAHCLYVRVVVYSIIVKFHLANVTFLVPWIDLDLNTIEYLEDFRTLWVGVSRFCAINVHDLLKITGNMFILKHTVQHSCFVWFVEICFYKYMGYYFINCTNFV